MGYITPFLTSRVETPEMHINRAKTVNEFYKNLYNAVVGWDSEDNIKIYPRLDSSESLKEARTNIPNLSNVKRIYTDDPNEFQSSIQKYIDFIDNSKDQPKLSKSAHEELEMRHSLYYFHGGFYEGLTSVNTNETKEINNRFPLTNGHPKLIPNSLLAQTLENTTSNYKVSIDNDSNGQTRLLRGVRGHNFYSIRKNHTTDSCNRIFSAPRDVTLANGINTSQHSLERVNKVKFTADIKSNSNQRAATSDKSKYIVSELEIANLKNILQTLYALRELKHLNSTNNKNPSIDASQLLEKKTAFLEKSLNERGVSLDTVRIFIKNFLYNATAEEKLINTLAENLAVAIRDLHRNSYTHTHLKSKSFSIYQDDLQNLDKKLNIKISESYFITKSIPDQKAFLHLIEESLYTSPEAEHTKDFNPYLNNSYNLGLIFKHIYGHSNIDLLFFQKTQVDKGDKAVKNLSTITKHEKEFENLVTLDHIADKLLHPTPEKRQRISAGAYSKSGLMHNSIFQNPEKRIKSDTEWQTALKLLIQISTAITDEHIENELDPIWSLLEKPSEELDKSQSQQLHKLVRTNFENELGILDNDLISKIKRIFFD